jgi:hypothetical protein
MAKETHAELFDLAISGDGISIKRKIEPAVARRIISLVMDAGADDIDVAARLPTRQTKTGNGLAEDRLSLREYLDECGATRYPDKITAIGKYVIDHEGQPHFSREDVLARFRTAGESAPGNYGRDFAWALKNGWIAEDRKEKGAFYVTQKGSGAVAGKFGPDVKKATRQPSGRRKSRKKGGGAE